MTKEKQEENTLKYSSEEVLDNLIHTINTAKEESKKYTSLMPQILENMGTFLKKQPTPPKSWLDRVGSNAHKFEYHQIVLPYDLRNPIVEDLENIELIETMHEDKYCMALEYFLLDRNRFIWVDGHYPPIYSPKPLLLLDNLEPSEEVNWDCYLYIFPDGSFLSYNMENEQDAEEMVGTEVFQELQQFYETVAKLQMKFPGEHVDYGFIGQEL
ncbi:MAG: hypothetical protein OCC49_16275 [Fibrobacterales bacterium]